MHRDLKPENILLQSKENKYEIKVIDFGLACQISKGQKGVILYRRCGTPGYVAPEILNQLEKDQMYGIKCDVFSVGVMLYILVVGKQPFYNANFANILKENRKCEINFEVPELLKNENKYALDLLKLMLEVNPQKRISAEEALQHAFFSFNNEINSLSCNSPIYISLQSFNQNIENKVNVESQDSINYLLTGDSKIICRTSQ